MTSSDIALLALATAIAGGLIGAGIMCAAGIIAEPLSRIASALTPEDEAFPSSEEDDAAQHYNDMRPD